MRRFNEGELSDHHATFAASRVPPHRGASSRTTFRQENLPFIKRG